MFCHAWVMLAAMVCLTTFEHAEAKTGASSPPNQATADPQVHEGMVVSASTGQLSMRAADGKEHMFKTNDMTRITVNGKPGKLEDLKSGMAIRVMLDAMKQVTAISTVDDRK